MYNKHDGQNDKVVGTLVKKKPVRLGYKVMLVYGDPSFFNIKEMYLTQWCLDYTLFY